MNLLILLACFFIIFPIHLNYCYNQNVKNYQHIINDEVSLPREISITEFQYQGMIDWGGWTWTYYTLSMFPGQTSTPVEGRHVNSDGFVCDTDGYIILASVDLPPYTVVETPFGYRGKVYDTGCPHGILDVYSDW